MEGKGAQMKSNWLYYGILLLTVEKIVQHIVVTLAFYFNWKDIASSVVVSPTLLLISGALVAILFVVSLWGLLKKQIWSVNVLIALALFDLFGEFVAQGRVAITMTVSFLAATVLLALCVVYRRGIRPGERQEVT
jgi:hypothetical protein